MHRTKLSVASLLLAISVAAVGCKGKEGGDTTEKPADQGATPTTETPKPEQPAQAEGKGTIKATVTLNGTAPEMPKLDRKSDPFCAKTEKTAPYVKVADGKLADVLVRLPVGAVKGEAPDTPVVVDQVECMYDPYVQGAVTGQQIQIKNSDKTTHNVHTYVGDETIFNEAQPPGAGAIEKEIEADPSNVMRFQCDVHKWMAAYVVITDHPHFGTTDESGTVTLTDVPAGEYELEAWHPHLGVQKQKVTVEKDGTAEVAFTFDAASYKAPQ